MSTVFLFFLKKRMGGFGKVGGKLGILYNGFDKLSKISIQKMGGVVFHAQKNAKNLRPE